MTRDELMEMAREAGFQTGVIYLADGVSSYPLIRALGENCNVSIEKLFNAILERAAVECEEKGDSYWHGDGATAAHGCASDIRALKIKDEA